MPHSAGEGLQPGALPLFTGGAHARQPLLHGSCHFLYRIAVLTRVVKCARRVSPSSPRLPQCFFWKNLYSVPARMRPMFERCSQMTSAATMSEPTPAAATAAGSAESQNL